MKKQKSWWSCQNLKSLNVNNWKENLLLTTVALKMINGNIQKKTDKTD